MYKYLVVGIALAIIGASGYYIISSGGGTTIQNAYLNNPETTMNPPTEDSILGAYICNTSSGCLTTYKITLNDSFEVVFEEFSLNTIEIDSNETSLLASKKGSWELTEKGTLIFTFKNKEDLLEEDLTITVKKIMPDTLSRLSYNKEKYSFKDVPFFIRISKKLPEINNQD